MTWEATGRAVATYLYDANGNLTKKDDGTNVEAYGYDFRNLMASYDGPGSNNDGTYRYGASGLRVQKTVGGSTTTKYYHDGLNTVAECNGSNQLQRTYVTPGLDQNLSLTASGGTYYYLSDALGSIRQVLDADQVTQNSYDYQAFGSVYGSPTENLTQPFRFTGREWDPESGVYYYRARTFAGALARFLARDPNGRDSFCSLYVYVSNAPLTYIDPLGLDELDLIEKRNMEEGAQFLECLADYDQASLIRDLLSRGSVETWDNPAGTEGGSHVGRSTVWIGRRILDPHRGVSIRSPRILQDTTEADIECLANIATTFSHEYYHTQQSRWVHYPRTVLSVLEGGWGFFGAVPTYYDATELEACEYQILLLDSYLDQRRIKCCADKLGVSPESIRRALQNMRDKAASARENYLRGWLW